MKHTSIALVLAAAAFALNAETVIWNTGTEFNVDRDGANLPREGDVLDIRISNNKSLLVNATGDEVSFDGTVVITNRTASYAHPGVLIYRAHRAFSGKGTIITDAIRIDTGVSLTNRQSALKIGYGIMENSNTTAAKYVFPDGILFGAWGDWSNTPSEANSTVDVELAGDIAFDTLDCFDGATSHSITLGEVKDAGVTSLSATGGGTVTLQIAAGFVGELAKIEVGDGTTLDLTGVGAKIFAGDLVIGAGATLKFDASKCPLEVVGSLDVDQSAHFEVSVSGSLSSGTLYHVFDSLHALPAGVLSCDAPEGWSVMSNGGSVYLDDGNLPSFPYGDSVYAWLGSQSSSWGAAGNWTKNVVPAGGVETYFARVANPCVVYDYTGSYAGQLRNLQFNANCGPFVVSGNELKPSYGSASSQSVKSESAFPVVISNFMACASDPGGCFLNNGGSYVALVGGGSSKGSLRYRGDVRLGGTWTATNIIEMANPPAGSRKSRLTILKEGLFDMTAATGTAAFPPGLSVNGSLAIDGVTIVDPVSVSGSGSIVKRGPGALVLETGDSRFGGEFRVEGGMIAFGETLATEIESGWTRIFTAKSFSGIDSAVLGGRSFRIVAASGGLCALEVRPARGMIFLVK